MGTYDDTDWFRSSRWTPEIAAQFESKLARARSWNRAQYVRIQAVHLVNQEEEAARVAGRALFKRVIADYSDDRLQVLSATEQLGIAFAAAGDPDQAESYLRQVLQLIADSPTGRSGTTGMTELVLAEILAARGHRADMHESKALLDAVEPEISRMNMFRDSVLRYLVVQARVADALGDAGAESFALDALAVAAETEPSIPRHPDVGRPIASPKVLEEMRRIAGVSAVERSRWSWLSRTMKSKPQGAR